MELPGSIISKLNFFPKTHLSKTATIGACLMLFSCGGGSGGQDTPPSPTVNPGTSTSQRIARMRFDYDNNGVFEGVTEFAYDSSGRIETETYTYTDDGVGDLHIQGTLQSWLGQEDLSNTTTYTYDSNGYLDTWVVEDSQLRATTTYTFDTAGLLTRLDEVLENVPNTVVNGYYHLLSYSGQQLTGHTQHQISDDLLLFTHDITYKSDGTVETNHKVSNTFPYDSTEWHFFRPDGQPDSIRSTNDTASQVNLIADYSYNGSDQLTQYDIYVGGFGFSRIYGSNGKVSEVHYDLGFDDVVDAVIQYEWENGDCTPLLQWYPRMMVYDLADGISPYQPGTGYYYAGHCDRGML